MTTKDPGRLLVWLASIERGQNVRLVDRIDFAPAKTLIQARGQVFCLTSADTDVPALLGRMRVSGLRVYDPIPDSIDRVYDITDGGHIVWVELLHFLGAYYRSAFHEESPTIDLDRIEHNGSCAHVWAHVNGDGAPPRKFTISLDASLDALGIPYDIRYSLRSGAPFEP